MKLSISVEGIALPSRFDPSPLLSRLRTALEHELQVAATSDIALDVATHRAALARAIARIQASRVFIPDH